MCSCEFITTEFFFDITSHCKVCWPLKAYDFFSPSFVCRSTISKASIYSHESMCGVCAFLYDAFFVVHLLVPCFHIYNTVHRWVEHTQVVLPLTMDITITNCTRFLVRRRRHRQRQRWQTKERKMWQKKKKCGIKTRICNKITFMRNSKHERCCRRQMIPWRIIAHGLRCIAHLVWFSFWRSIYAYIFSFGLSFSLFCSSLSCQEAYFSNMLFICYSFSAWLFLTPLNALSFI